MVQFVLAQQNAPAGGGAIAILPFALVLLIFYFLMYRPMRKRQKALEAMVASLKNGDKVITSGGIYGTVAGIRENTVTLKVAEQAKIEIAKSAIASLQSAPPDAK